MKMATSSSVPSEEAISKMDAQLTCSICLERYTDPRVLPCHHSFCKDCLNRLPIELEGGKHTVKCPTCRTPTQLGDKGASALPTAFHINNFLEIDELLKKIPASEPHQECPNHNKPRDIYCETCEELVCFKCSVQAHQGHECNRAVDVFEKHKQQIKACLQPVKKKIDDIKQTLDCFDTREREIKAKGEAVQKEIDITIQQLIDELQKAKRTLSEEVVTAVQDKLQLHSCQRAEVESVLVQLKSCQEFIKKELKSRSQYQIQSAKKELVQRINDTHSEVKVSELHPIQRADTAFVKNHSLLSACSNMGYIQSLLIMRSVPGLVSVDIPKWVRTGTRVEVFLTTPSSLSSKLRLSCQLIPPHDKPIDCPVTTTFEGQFSVILHPAIAGPHQLKVMIAGADIYSSPFAFHVLSLADLRKKKLTGFSGCLERPCGIAVTDDGQHVVVAEWKAGCVTVLSGSGELVRRFGSYGSGPGKIEHPWGVAVSADNHIFVTSHNNSTLQKFTFTGHHVASAGLRGFGLAVHQDGRVYSVNKGDCKVDVFHPDLTLSHSFGDTSCFINPLDIAIDTKGMVYVTDSSKQEVLKFTPEGQYLTSIGSQGEKPHQFSWPLGICIDSDGVMYVTDYSKRQVMMFTIEGVFLGSFGSTGELAFQPRGIAVDKTGNLYICDHGTNRVLVSRLSDVQ